MAETPDRSGPVVLTQSAVATVPIVDGWLSTGWLVLTHVRVVNTIETKSPKVTIGVFTSAADGAGRRLEYRTPVPYGRPLDYDTYIPILAGEVVYALDDSGSVLELTLSYWRSV